MIKTLLPRLYYSTHFNKSSIGQLYTVSNSVDTFFCFNNHQGFLFPHEEKHLEIKIDLQSAKGKKLLAKTFHLKPHDSLNLSIRELLKSEITLTENEQLGTIVCTSPNTTMQNHFYTYYTEEPTGSVAMIHPQSTVGRKNTDRTWISNQLINTKGLKKLVLYQMNHSRQKASCNYTLTTHPTGVEFQRKTTTVHSLGANKVEFDLTGAPALLSLSLDNLISPNGKPLIMRRFNNNKFTINHG